MNIFEDIFNKLYGNYGPQYWWPGDNFDEIVIGAVLTQNTNWKNVEKAITNLKNYNIFDLKDIRDIDRVELAELVRPSGYFNVKSKRLKAAARGIIKIKSNKPSSVTDLRKKLLEIYGIGKETADSIILYAFEQPIFVIDAYTKRIFSRIGLISKKMKYDKIRKTFEDNLQKDRQLFNEYHALIVVHAKVYCKRKPLCKSCPLLAFCSYGKSNE